MIRRLCPAIVALALVSTAIRPTAAAAPGRARPAEGVDAGAPGDREPSDEMPALGGELVEEDEGRDTYESGPFRAPAAGRPNPAPLASARGGMRAGALRAKFRVLCRPRC